MSRLKNRAYQVEYYLDGDDPKVWTLVQYIIVYDPETKLGKLIDGNLYEETGTDEQKRLAKLDTYLRKQFGFGENEVAFYYGNNSEMTEAEIIDGVKQDGDIIVVDNNLGEPIYEKKGEK